MRSFNQFFWVVLFFLCSSVHSLQAYPIDGYESTGIRRLNRLQYVQSGKLKGTLPLKGQAYPSSAIRLNLMGPQFANFKIPDSDPDLLKKIKSLKLYDPQKVSIAVLQLSPTIRYASFGEDKSYMPGSVGKLAIIAGVFAELRNRFPGDVEARKKFLRDHRVKANVFSMSDEHVIPIFDPQTLKYVSRPVQVGDVFSLYEWIDFMLSSSSNSAASMVWKELILMRAFGNAYPVTGKQEEAFFRETKPLELQKLALSVVNDPLRTLGIRQDEWQLGSMFTHGGYSRVPMALSYGTPAALMKYMVAMEEGKLVDPWSSLELKKLIYMTGRRIRYASAPRLNEARVYFKSGSQYKCRPEPGFVCGKYKGNVENYMNSVAEVEWDSGKTYIVIVMSNVLRRDSVWEHQFLGGEIDRILGE